MLPQLMGPALSGLDEEITGFLVQAGNDPSSTQVANFLKLYKGDDRTRAAQALAAHGVSATAISNALTWLSVSDRTPLSTIYGIASVASAAISGYHGYKRNNSIGWAIGWFFLGSIFPVITPVVAFAQGFGKRKAA